MKKSEAIAKLKWYIEEQNSGQVCAEQILAFVEGTLGMQPPNTSEPVVLARDGKGRPICFGGYSYYGYDRWEAEGEELEQYKREQADASWQEPEDGE